MNGVGLLSPRRLLGGYLVRIINYLGMAGLLIIVIFRQWKLNQSYYYGIQITLIIRSL